MIEELIKYFKETPREQILKDWEESKEYDKIGIPVLEYISKIDLYNKKIKHIGCYDINRNVSIDEIFN